MDNISEERGEEMSVVDQIRSEMMEEILILRGELKFCKEALEKQTTRVSELEARFLKTRPAYDSTGLYPRAPEPFL